MSLPSAIFRNDETARQLVFDRPHEIIVARSADEFAPALEAAQAASDQGRWLAGYFSYEAGYLLEPKLVPLLPENRRAPLICLGVFDAPVEQTVPGSNGAATNGPIFDARAAWSADDYAIRFARLHDHLRKGDCYQGNLTFPVHAQWSGDPLAAFNALTARQPVKYGALVSLGDPVVLSRSPELFFEIDAEGMIETHPMKGTAPRGSTRTEDARLKAFLRNDEKNQAENRMIVDLLRNDISLISEVGTLEVPELFRIETYPTVHQMVSRVRARLLPDVGIRRIFAALFPCGSITGAPKIRAMEILRDLEGVPRDVYCGAIGWIAPGGTMRFSVAIRTISLFADGEAVYNVGGGVVFDSTAEEEYRECLLKARFATGTVPTSS
ncbi:MULTISPECIES: aminodeoxychorismate synthase component I [unclassified Mesorhizobium]|uniref:aminodeoxychorismate synthase component I n=1 Tax=unclassified Mesorhizobium TaxID=325217 RepID=UPI000BAEF397|nr:MULTISPECIES: aminodeoxychorismate synthase component I [unclassified Mesorhizobium]TGT56585.1 aminodeoxychorismate synthase component I [Mesorhizobium sp. M00.F.Ca.ET.170.01.1.1]AZO11645.1 aminodeoxychorismate synthase component I [Mesorhizobium sp. M3A.F.Ca.ET.080.04.2.1]PBB86736.1 aminodeoxychorismate synthase, component I [Mesorhizobium sp. WSM3876]RWB72719.1 MAG: aminodeoxychorismate synthase component I [Mesorhizobium sp.]RWB87007.1 MAG: aminodeoxychorismate synthase component I [Meso